MTSAPAVEQEVAGSKKDGDVSFRFLQGRLRTTAAVLLCLLAILGSVSVSWGEDVSVTRRRVQALKKLDLEELMNVVVRPPSLEDQLNLSSGQEVKVLTREDFRRWGVATLADALRLAPELEVAQMDAQTCAVRVRDFYDPFAWASLVLKDGDPLPPTVGMDFRSDLAQARLDELDHIEIAVSRGALRFEGRPVGCVINLVTRQAVESLEFQWLEERRDWLP